MSSFVFVGVMELIVGSSLFHACRPQVLNFGRLIPILPFYTGFVVVSLQILAFSVFLLQVVVGPLPAQISWTSHGFCEIFYGLPYYVGSLCLDFRNKKNATVSIHSYYIRRYIK